MTRIESLVEAVDGGIPARVRNAAPDMIGQ